MSMTITGGVTFTGAFNVTPAPPNVRAIFGYGFNGSYFSVTNIVSSSGVVATDTTGVGTARGGLAAATYGTDKAILDMDKIVVTQYYQ